MTNTNKYFSVNWVDGMKINKDHFIQQDKANSDKIRRSVSTLLNSMNYGVIPSWNSQKENFDIILKIDNHKHLKVKILNCRAITPGGMVIDIVGENDLKEISIDLSPEMDKLQQSENKLFYIILTTNIFDTEPWGQQMEEESPPRYPYVRSSHTVRIIEVEQFNKIIPYPDSLVIGKLLLSQDKPNIEESYIPPCMSIFANRELIRFYENIDKFLHQLELFILSIIRKIREKEQKTSLAQSTLRLSKNLLNYLNQVILPIKWETKNTPPIHLFCKMAGIARVMRNTIDSEKSSNKEELLNYFTNWSELKQGDLEKLLVYCVNFEYRHYDIEISVEQFKEFFEIVLTLFTKLESLAYIGKKKETGIFVKEHKTKRSFLAD